VPIISSARRSQFADRPPQSADAGPEAIAPTPGRSPPGHAPAVATIQLTRLDTGSRAIAVTLAPGSSVAATKRSFSAALQRRRRSTDVMTSTRPFAM
jgi:hypothetical protein